MLRRGGSEVGQEGRVESQGLRESVKSGARGERIQLGSQAARVRWARRESEVGLARTEIEIEVGWPTRKCEAEPERGKVESDGQQESESEVG